MSDSIGKIFVREFVIGFGFFGGMGIDPESAIYKALSSIVTPHASNLSFIFWLFPIISFIISVWGTLRLGGIVGVCAVIIAAIAGWQFSNPSNIGVWMLLISMLIGFVAPYVKN